MKNGQLRPLVLSGGPPTRAPRREEIAGATLGRLRTGRTHKPDLLVVDLGAGPLVVKDYAGKPWRTRLLGRRAIRREYRAYRWLGQAPGLPTLIGQVDDDAIALELVNGVQLALSPYRFYDGPALLAKLRGIVDGFRQRGLAHLDLRGRRNLLVTPDGEVIVVDLAGAVWFRPGSLAYRLCFRWFDLVQETAFLKWKSFLVPEEVTAAEERLLRRLRLPRLLWLVKPRGRLWRV